jgi:hypothetical protein
MTDRTKELFLPRLLMSLISLTIVGLGLVTIVTGHYFGSTSKLGGAEVSLDGSAATAMGVSTLLFGLFPLALWFRTRRPAIGWVVACFVAAGVAFYVSLRLHRV